MTASPVPRLTPAHQEQFVAMLPTITCVARQAFSQLDPEAREEATAEVVAAAFVMYVKRGYTPDGLGLFQAGRHCVFGDVVTVNHDLCVCFTKRIR